jgi:hypothetical protein
VKLKVAKSTIMKGGIARFWFYPVLPASRRSDLDMRGISSPLFLNSSKIDRRN